MSKITTYIDINSLIDFVGQHCLTNEPLINAIKNQLDAEHINLKILSNYKIEFKTSKDEKGQTQTQVFIYRKMDGGEKPSHSFLLPFALTSNNLVITDKMDSASINPFFEDEIASKKLVSDELMLLAADQQLLNNCQLISNKLKTYRNCELNVDHLVELEQYLNTLPNNIKVKVLIDIDGTLFDRNKTRLIGETVVNEQIVQLMKKYSEKYSNITFHIISARTKPCEEQQKDPTMLILNKFQQLAGIKLEMDNNLFIGGTADKIPFFKEFMAKNAADLYLYIEDVKDYVEEASDWPKVKVIRAMSEKDKIEIFEERIEAALARLQDAQNDTAKTENKEKLVNQTKEAVSVKFFEDIFLKNLPSKNQEISQNANAVNDESQSRQYSK